MRTCPKCQRTYPDDADFCLKDGTPLPSPSSVTESELSGGLARRYRIVKKLGVGGMGAVFLAEQIALGNRPVALKVLSRRLLDDPEFLLRFHDEATSTARIRHANVVTIYESGQSDDGTPYIAMEYLEGETVRQALRTRGALPVAECAEILSQAARGLNAAHKLGIIHRDLKPDNIFLTYPDDVGAGLVPALPVGTAETGQAQGPPLRPVVVKLVDFGIAKLRESTAHTLTGTVLGTPAYMSFEQASGMRSDQLDGRSDVYSLGVVAYEMLTGRTPFHSDTPVGYLRMHMQEAPPPFRAVKPDLPALPEIENVVIKALTKDRDQRYGSVLEFARDFAKSAQSSPVAQSPSTAAPTRIVSPPTLAKLPDLPDVKQNSSWAKFAVLGLGLLAIIAFAIWYLARSAEQLPTQITNTTPRDTVPVGEEAKVAPPFKDLSGTVVVETSPRAGVFLDDSNHGTTDANGKLSISGLAAGSHELRISSSGKKELRQEITVHGGQVAVVRALLEDVGPPPGTVRENPKDGLKYLWIPPGSFLMGCSPADNECRDNENPPHQVTITKGFWIGQTEVTAGAYKRFVRAARRQMPPEPVLEERALNPGWYDDSMPIVAVTWDDARAYCSWAGGWLPTEARWEYAARAGDTGPWYRDRDEVAWSADNSGRNALDSTRIWNEDEANYAKRLDENGNGMHEVGQKSANAFGLYDMLGNVMEWVNDWYDEKYYQGSPMQDPSGPAGGQMHVLRGGCWYYTPESARASVRNSYSPNGRGSFVGFRCGGEVFAP